MAFKGKSKSSLTLSRRRADHAAMAKLTRALLRLVLVTATVLGVLTVLEFRHRPPDEGVKFSSSGEFFHRASHYRILEVQVSNEEEKAEGSAALANDTSQIQIVDELLLRFQDRKRAINKVCANDVSNVAKSIPVNNWEFLINHEFKLMWCSIFKSASSSWFDYFMKLAGVDPHVKKNSDVELARKTAYPRPSLEYLEIFLNDSSYTSFIIVREPFERILSSYQDKIVNPKLKFYQEARCRMAKSKISRNCKPSFAQFVDFILSEDAAGQQLDEHWMPYTLFCSICQVNYTYVLKFENLHEEQDYLVRHVPGLEKYPLLHEHSSSRDYSSLVREYYSQLSRTQLDGLVNLYRDDFLVSQHSWLKYYDYIQHKT